MRPLRLTAWTLVAALCLTCAAASANEVLRPGERLKIGLSGGRMADRPLWLLRQIGDDGLLAMPNGHTISAAGRPRGEIEAQLMEQFGAGLAVISRLDAGEDHGGGVVAAADQGPQIDLSAVRLPDKWTGKATLEDVVMLIHDIAGIQAIVNYPALELEGIKRDAEADLAIPPGTRLDVALDHVLSQLGSAAFAELTWQAIDGTLHITTWDDAARRVETRVYDVTPFDLDEVMDVICDTVYSDSWRENGGTIGSISVVDGRLVITQMPRMHGEIGALLAKLRGPSN